jgi:hypothetical protein
MEKGESLRGIIIHLAVARIVISSILSPCILSTGIKDNF